MFEEKTEIISESTYTDKQGFEIREGLDQDRNRVLLKIHGSGLFFSIPDGICALAKDAFSEVTESLRYVFIPISVKPFRHTHLHIFAGNSNIHKTEKSQTNFIFYVKLTADLRGFLWKSVRILFKRIMNFIRNTTTESGADIVFIPGETGTV